jgi:hypothetical protein
MTTEPTQSTEQAKVDALRRSHMTREQLEEWLKPSWQPTVEEEPLPIERGVLLPTMAIKVEVPDY